MCMQTQEGTNETVNSISHLSLKLVEDTNSIWACFLLILVQPYLLLLIKHNYFQSFLFLNFTSSNSRSYIHCPSASQFQL